MRSVIHDPGWNLSMICWSAISRHIISKVSHGPSITSSESDRITQAS